MSKNVGDGRGQEAAGGAVRGSVHVAVDFPWDASACMGTGAYSETMVRALANAAPDFKITLIVPVGAPRAAFPANVFYRDLPGVDALREGTRQVALPSVLHELKADCLFAPATLLPLVKVCPMISTVHDLSFVRTPHFYGSGLLEYLERWFDPTLEAADAIVAISEETRRDLVELKNVPEDKLVVIQQPVRGIFEGCMDANKASARLASLGVEKPYLFHVSNLSPHKNVAFALEVFSAFVRMHGNSRHSFVFAGGGYAPNQPPDLLALARSLGVGDRVQYVGKVNDETLKALYQECEAFLFPSLAEGWGLPVAEASASKVRVLASPGIPAAGVGQRHKLEVEEWVQALASPGLDTGPGIHVSAREAGRELAELILKVIRSCQSQESISGTWRTSAMPERSSMGGDGCTGISGCTIVRNGVQLGYPLEASIESYASLCDEVILCWDPTSEDSTKDLVIKLAGRFRNIKLVESVWDLHSREGGREIARQTQIAFSHCSKPWTLYIQADEAVHEESHGKIRGLVRREDLAGASFERRSFFRTLDREIPAMSAEAIVRLFRTGHGRSIGDAMHVAVDGHAGHIERTDCKLFNYSRMGSDPEIRQRSDNLNRFYHNDDFISRLDPDRNKDWATVRYIETHPGPIERVYRETVIPHRTPSSGLQVVITVDDIRPEPGCGLELESGPLGLLRDLHSEFGCKFTLFMPTNYYGRTDLRDHEEWFRFIVDLGIFEIACHGHHHWNLIEGRGDMEYSAETSDEVRASIVRSLETFQSLGYRPRGAKPPGWGYRPQSIDVFSEHFDYLADHLEGAEWKPSEVAGFLRLPYTRCIHEPLEDLLTPPGSLLVLHSHLSPEGGKHRNGWDSNNQSNVRGFLKKLTRARGDSIAFVTAAESLPRSTRPRSESLPLGAV